MTNRAARAIAECRLIATMTEEPGRITRRFLTTPMHAVHDHLRARMELDATCRALRGLAGTHPDGG